MRPLNPLFPLRDYWRAGYFGSFPRHTSSHCGLVLLGLLPDDFRVCCQACRRLLDIGQKLGSEQRSSTGARFVAAMQSQAFPLIELVRQSIGAAPMGSELVLNAVAVMKVLAARAALMPADCGRQSLSAAGPPRLPPVACFVRGLSRVLALCRSSQILGTWTSRRPESPGAATCLDQTNSLTHM